MILNQSLDLLKFIKPNKGQTQIILNQTQFKLKKKKKVFNQAQFRLIQ